MSEYVMNHTGEQLDEAIDKVLNGYIKPEGTIDITEGDNNTEVDVTKYALAKVQIPIPTFKTKELTISPSESSIIKEAVLDSVDGYSKVVVDQISSTYIGSGVPKKEYTLYTPQKGSQVVISSGQYLNGEQVIDSIPDNYVDTSEGDADIYDIYKNKIAFVNGEKVVGAYAATPAGGSQYNCNSSNCSVSSLIIPCDFEPRYACIILNSATHSTNTVIAAMFIPSAAVYHSRTSSGVTRNQQTTNLSSYWSWDSTNKQLILNRPNTSYSWSSYNYRIFIFK